MPFKVRLVFSGEVFLSVCLIVVTVVLLYGHTLQVPFYLDDYGGIVENYLLRDLFETLKSAFTQRGLTNLSFALNIRFTGFSLPAFHLTNIALHVLCGLMVWLLLRKLLQRHWLPLFGALLFVSHPLQTQGVTYLIQRSTVLGTFFFLASVLLYLQSREALATGWGRCSSRYLSAYLGAVLAGCCAALSKENTATLPLVLIAYDQLFPLPVPRSHRQALVDHVPFCIVPLLLAGNLLPAVISGTLVTSQTGIVSLQHNSPSNYLITQFSVFWCYLRLLLLPFWQALEHDYPVTGGLFTPQNIIAFAGGLMLAWLFWRMRRNQPLLVYGMLWFVCGLLVESSIIPLDPLFEHRLYLPMFGFILVLLEGISLLAGDKKGLTIFFILLLSWMSLTWQRNALWKDPIAFYEDNLELALRSERVSLALILLYKDSGRYSDAERMAKGLLQTNPRFVLAYRELAELLARRGAWEEAFAVVERALQQWPQEPTIYRSGAAIYLSLGKPQQAIEFMQRGVGAAPQDAGMYSWLAALYFELGELSLAETTYRECFRLNDKSANTHKNLAKVLYAQGRVAEALSELQTALALAPGSPDILEGIVKSALALGDRKTMIWAVDKLRFSDPMVFSELQAAIFRQSQ